MLTGWLKGTPTPVRQRINAGLWSITTLSIWDTRMGWYVSSHPFVLWPLSFSGLAKGSGKGPPCYVSLAWVPRTVTPTPGQALCHKSQSSMRLPHLSPGRDFKSNLCPKGLFRPVFLMPDLPESNSSNQGFNLKRWTVSVREMKDVSERNETASQFAMDCLFIPSLRFSFILLQKH